MEIDGARLVASEAPPGWTMTELKGEVIGTFTLILGGCSVVATAQRRDVDWKEANPGVQSDPHAMAMYMNLGWAVSVAMGVMVSFDASGAHLNPAVTLSAMIHDAFGTTKGLMFMAAQFLGAFFAALVCMMMFTTLSGSQEKYVDNFYHTGPSPGTNWINALFVEVLGTAMLLLMIKFVATGGPPKPNKSVMALSVGAIIFFIGMNLGYMTGYSLNPARDLAPRFARFLQFGAAGTFDSFDWFAPIVGPLIGAPLGTAIWKVCSKPEEEEAKEA